MQTTTERFKELVTSPVVGIDWGLQMSLRKEVNPDIQFFILDDSLLDGTDILKPSDDNPLLPWYQYDYKPFKDRVISMEWSREVDFPYSVQSAMADVTLRNTDGYFTPGGSSPVQEYILPKRPIILFQGFLTAENLGQFVGMTQDMPSVSATEASFHALDFLSELYEIPLTNMIAMQNAYTHEVLEVMFLQLGLSPVQFDLARSRNKIPYLFFERGIKAGEALRQLMQAEGGLLWLDEQGVIKFTPRVEIANDPVYVLNESTIVDVNLSSESQLINNVIIRSNVRDVQEFQSVHTKTSAGEGTDEAWVIPPSDSIVKLLSITDPIINAQEPTLGHASGVSWFTARDVTGTPVTSGITVTASETLTNSYSIEFTNSNAFAVEIDELDLWAQPAKLVDEQGMRYELQSDSSVEKYGLQTYEIENDFIGTIDNANSLALMILDSFSEYHGMLEVSVRINPALELGDVVEVNYREYQGTYKIEKITNIMRVGVEVSQVLKLRRYTVRNWFVLSSNDEPRSLLDGGDQLTY